MKIKKILVSQPNPLTEKNPYSVLSDKLGLTVCFRQFIRVEGVTVKEFKKERINLLDFGVIIFTSKTGIDNYFRLCEEMRQTVPESMKYICISDAIANYLQKHITYRKRKISFGSGKFDDLIKLIQKNKSEKFFVPLSDIHNQEIPEKLKKEKIDFQSAVLYKTVSADLSDMDITKYDVLVFFSPGGIISLKENFPNFEQGEMKIGAFGTQTCNAVKEAGLNLDIEAPTPQAPSMVMALEQFIMDHNKKK